MSEEVEHECACNCEKELEEKIQDWIKDNSHLLDQEAYYTLISLVGNPK